MFGELREFFDLESHSGLRLDDYRSLRDIAKLLHATPGKADWLTASPSSHDSPSRENTRSLDSPSRENTHSTLRVSLLSQTHTTSNSTSLNSHSTSELTSFLIDFVVEQTGYPPEIIELDADLEADLGIDSIKKAQLFGELRELFAIDPARLAKQSKTVPDKGAASIAEIRTLRNILDVLLAQQAPANPSMEIPLDKLANGSQSFAARIDGAATEITAIGNGEAAVPEDNAVGVGSAERSTTLLDNRLPRLVAAEMSGDDYAAAVAVEPASDGSAPRTG